MMNNIIDKEIKKILADHNCRWEQLAGKTVLITGATGLIGQTLVQFLLNVESESAPGLKIIAAVRNSGKALKLFGIHENLDLIAGDIREPIHCDRNVDYVIHAASATSSRDFIERPVDVIETAIGGTKQVLEFSREKSIKGFVYLSSMEVYGTPQTDELIDEQHSTDLDTTKVRSCYPESKRMCEALCVSYCEQYGVPARIIRLTQTFGPGVVYDDGRVFAEFARCAIEGRDIVLHTKGETKRSYLYTIDAVTAILTVLLNGENGEAYNAANEETYCSIYEMAELVAKQCAEGAIDVKIEETDAEKLGYAPVLHMNLKTDKIRSIGWKAETGLKEMYQTMIDDMAYTMKGGRL